MRAPVLVAMSMVALAACERGCETVDASRAGATEIVGERPSAKRPFRVEELGRFREPWAMTFLPGTGQALITEKRGHLKLWSRGGDAVEVAGVPTVDYGDQGGLGDVVLHPGFAENRIVYLSFAEAGERGRRGAAAGRGRLVIEGDRARLEGFEVIWRQQPKVSGRGHFGHRMAFSPDGRYLFITSGERQTGEPAQDISNTLGTIVRLTPEGGVPQDSPTLNPFADRGGVTAQIWTYGHRNPLGIAFAPDGRLWSHEMGPRHGDELNLIERGHNYGWPVVSEGNHYDGRDIPAHSTRPEIEAPRVAWVPAISPAGMIVYTGEMFPDWRGSALLGGLSGEVLVRVALEGDRAHEAERWDMGQRIREVEQGPDGSVYLLEDERGGSGGRLLRLHR